MFQYVRLILNVSRDCWMRFMRDAENYKNTDILHIGTYAIAFFITLFRLSSCMYTMQLPLKYHQYAWENFSYRNARQRIYIVRALTHSVIAELRQNISSSESRLSLMSLQITILRVFPTCLLQVFPLKSSDSIVGRKTCRRKCILRSTCYVTFSFQKFSSVAPYVFPAPR